MLVAFRWLSVALVEVQALDGVGVLVPRRPVLARARVIPRHLRHPAPARVVL